MPPPAIRLIATIFIGLPGLALWLGGLIAIGLVAAALATAASSQWLEAALISLGGVLATALGSGMFIGCRLFIHGNRHHLPVSRLVIINAVALAGQIAGVIAISCLVPGGYQLLAEEGKGALLPLGVSSVSIPLSFLLHRLGFDLRLKWEREHSATLRAWKEARRSSAPSQV